MHMGWLRFLGFMFNLFGLLFLAMAIMAIALGAYVGGATDGTTNVFGMVIGGMMGTLGGVVTVAASMMMFFFGGVISALRRIVVAVERRPIEPVVSSIQV
jgi:hypothetical protein